MQPGASLNLPEIISLLVGGLALFLYGLECMTGGLKAIAGARLQSLLGIAATLDAIREVASTSMLALSQRRMTHGADIDHLRNADTAAFAAAVVGQLDHAVHAVTHPDADADAVAGIVAAKPALEAMAATARQSVMAEQHLSAPEAAINFRLANDMIEHLNEIARLSRAMAKAAASPCDMRLDDAAPAAAPQLQEAP